jgi:hypothetical protein
MRSAGILILDNNCLRHLRGTDAVARFKSSLRVADLVFLPTEVNLLEIGAAQPEHLQRDLVAILRTIAAGEPFLPWPFTLLQSIGQSLVRGEATFRADRFTFEEYLSDPSALVKLTSEVASFNSKIEAEFSAFHDRQRQRLQAELKRRGEREGYGDARTFLERVWDGSEIRQAFADVTWRSFDLPGSPPMELLNVNEAWRLLLDIEGLAIYERTVARTQPKRVHRFDLIQLIYLAGAAQRILATGEAQLIRAGNLILARRYPNARVVHISEIISPAA